MVEIPFPPGIQGEFDLPQTREELRNCFVTRSGNLVSRPGIALLNTTGTQARGQFVWNGFLYQVTGERLIKITDLTLGTFEVNSVAIEGTANVETDFGFNETVIVVKGGQIYSLNSSDVLTDITAGGTDPLIALAPAVDVAQINGRFVYIPEDGSPAYFSEVGTAKDVAADSFFDAEELPDKNNSVFNFRNTLYIGGTDSFELFRNVATSAVFQRVTGSRVLHGFIGGLIEYNESFLFVGRPKGQSFGVFAITSGSSAARQISNERIDTVLEKYTETELFNAISGRFIWHNHDIAYFIFPDDAIGFIDGNWFFLDTIIDNERVPWEGGFITQFEGEYFTAGAGNIGILSTNNDEYGNAIAREIQTFAKLRQADGWFSVQSIGLRLSQGFNDGVGTVGLATSRNGVEFGDMMFRDLGDLGQYSKRLEWNYPGGLGTYDSFMGIKIRTTQDVIFSADSLVGSIRAAA